MLRWLFQYEKKFQIKALADVRTEIIERARYRLPDAMVFTTPAPFTRIMTCVPDIVIEILSPDDRQSEILDRFADYSTLGASHLIHMDPERYVAWRYQAGSLVKTDFQSLSLPGRLDVPFDTEALFEQLRQEIAEVEGNA